MRVVPVIFLGLLLLSVTGCPDKPTAPTDDDGAKVGVNVPSVDIRMVPGRGAFICTKGKDAASTFGRLRAVGYDKDQRAVFTTQFLFRHPWVPFRRCGQDLEFDVHGFNDAKYFGLPGHPELEDNKGVVDERCNWSIGLQGYNYVRVTMRTRNDDPQALTYDKLLEPFHGREWFADFECGKPVRFPTLWAPVPPLETEEGMDGLSLPEAAAAFFKAPDLVAQVDYLVRRFLAETRLPEIQRARERRQEFLRADLAALKAMMDAFPLADTLFGGVYRDTEDAIARSDFVAAGRRVEAAYGKLRSLRALKP